MALDEWIKYLQSDSWVQANRASQNPDMKKLIQIVQIQDKAIIKCASYASQSAVEAQKAVLIVIGRVTK